MKHLGDITKISGYNVPPVEVIIGGSPCQDLSIAGKREGLAGERSGLFMEQIRVIKEMRQNDRSAGRAVELLRPRFMVWENVPGVFSSRGGEDFRAVLEETARVADPSTIIPRPPKGKWTNAGAIVADEWSVAWRVLDAQFWGVPQRRRRIALVADFGGQSAPEILFEHESVSGDSEESGEARERAAGDTSGGTGAANNAGGITSPAAYTLKIRSSCEGGGKGPLVQNDLSATLSTHNDQTLFQPAYCIQGNCIDRADTAGCNGKGWTEDVSYTLNTIDRPAVCYSIDRAAFNQGENAKYDFEVSDSGKSSTLVSKGPSAVCYNADFRNGAIGEVSTTLQARTGRTLNAGGTVICMATQQGGAELRSDNKAPTLTAAAGMSGNNQPVVCYDTRGNGNGATVPTITGDHENRVTDYTAIAVEKSFVRRLTPLECERLQGFPDGWTDIGDYADGKGKPRKITDSARYKALGNSIAIPPWTYVLERLNAYCREHTMASLFDGIGGFPLIWERLNGKGSCMWSSEIEDFPIAVTRKHFGEKQDD